VRRYQARVEPDGTEPRVEAGTRNGASEGTVAESRDYRTVAEEPFRNHVAILMAMSLADQMSLAEVKNRLSEVVDQVERERGRVVITKHGRRAAVVMSLDDLESLEETLEVLVDQPLLEKVRKSMAELTAGKANVLTKDDALAVLPHK
jgi:antitoxin YefM